MEIPFLAQPQILKLHWKRQFSKYLGMTKMALSSTNHYFWHHFTINTFAILLLWSGLGLTKNSSKKCCFWDIFILGPFSIKFPIVTPKIYHHWKEKSYRGSRDSFGNGMIGGTTWEGVEYLVVTKVQIRIALRTWYGKSRPADNKVDPQYFIDSYMTCRWRVIVPQLSGLSRVRGKGYILTLYL